MSIPTDLIVRGTDVFWEKSVALICWLFISNLLFFLLKTLEFAVLRVCCPAFQFINHLTDFHKISFDHSSVVELPNFSRSLKLAWLTNELVKRRRYWLQ